MEDLIKKIKKRHEETLIYYQIEILTEGERKILRSEMAFLLMLIENNTDPLLSDGSIFSTDDVNTILDAYQIECQLKFNTGTIPDAKEWFAKMFYFR